MNSSFKWMGPWAGALLLTAEVASAQTFGSDDQFAVSAERLFGVVFASESTEDAGATQTVNLTTLSVLSSPMGSLTTSYSFPRVGADFVLGDGPSIGAALGLFTLSGSAEVEQGGVSAKQDTGSGTGFLLMPRVGLPVMFQEHVGIWPRAGISYIAVSSESGDGSLDTSSNRLALTLEVPLVLSPVPHTGFIVAPTLDVGLSGSNETSTDATGAVSSAEQDVTGTEYGLQAGLFLYF